MQAYGEGCRGGAGSRKLQKLQTNMSRPLSQLSSHPQVTHVGYSTGFAAGGGGSGGSTTGVSFFFQLFQHLLDIGEHLDCALNLSTHSFSTRLFHARLNWIVVSRRLSIEIEAVAKKIGARVR